MIQIYGSAGSSAGRCYWMLEELGLDYQGIPVNFRNGDHKKPEYLQMNPNGKVPVFKDGETILWESMAINFYLAEKYKPEFLGLNTEDKAQALKWSFWALAEYQKPIIDVFIQKVFVPEDKRDAAAIEKNLEKIGPLNEILNASLQNRTNLVGTDFTIADLNVASVAKICNAIGVDLSKYTALKSWLDKMLTRPAAQKVSILEAR